MVQNKKIILIILILFLAGIVHAVWQSTEEISSSSTILKMKQNLDVRIVELDLATEQSKTSPSDFIKKYGSGE